MSLNGKRSQPPLLESSEQINVMFGNFGKIDYSSSTSKNHPCFYQKLALNESSFLEKIEEGKLCVGISGNVFILEL